MIVHLEEGIGEADVSSIDSADVGDKWLAEQSAVRVIYDLAMRAEIHIVLGPAALSEISASRRIDRIAKAYALVGKAVRLFPVDEGALKEGSHLSIFAEVAALNNLSQKDRKILADALVNECDAVITCDYRLIRAMQYVPVEYRRRLAFLSPADWLTMNRR
jgi:hypothetical protein